MLSQVPKTIRISARQIPLMARLTARVLLTASASANKKPSPLWELWVIAERQGAVRTIQNRSISYSLRKFSTSFFFLNANAAVTVSMFYGWREMARRGLMNQWTLNFIHLYRLLSTMVGVFFGGLILFLDWIRTFWPHLAVVINTPSFLNPVVWGLFSFAINVSTQLVLFMFAGACCSDTVSAFLHTFIFNLTSMRVD